MFADDLNVFHVCPRATSNQILYATLEETRNGTHKWGRMNRVTFDAGKEHFNILHPRGGEGDEFKLLGCVGDNKLSITSAIDAILKRTRLKIRAMLRTRGHYDLSAMMSQYKTQIWGFSEYANGCICHAVQS